LNQLRLNPSTTIFHPSGEELGEFFKRKTHCVPLVSFFAAKHNQQSRESTQRSGSRLPRSVDRKSMSEKKRGQARALTDSIYAVLYARSDFQVLKRID
jgi:hypothetical protein